LDFVPLVTENYHLVCLKSALQEPAIESLQAVLRSTAWHERLQSLGTYAVDREKAGEVQSLRQTLPWWNYRKKKPA
jgi:putative molybdopterin biosynthesis protein